MAALLFLFGSQLMRSFSVIFGLLFFIFSFTGFAQTQQNFETITVENASNLVEIRTWADTNGDFSPVAFSPDGSELAVALNNGQIEFVSTETLKTVRVVNGIETEAEWLDYRSDGTELLLSKRTGVYTLVDVERGEILAVNTITSEPRLFTPTWDTRKYVLSSYDDDIVSVHDTVTGQELLSVEATDCWQVSKDGAFLLTCEDDIVQIWDIELEEIVFEIASPSHDTFSGAGFTQNGLVWVANRQYIEPDNQENWITPIEFWNMASGELAFQLDGVSVHYYSSLITDPTNTFILAWGLSQTFSDSCWIWNISENEQIDCPAGGNMWINFSPDGQLLAISSGTSYNVYLRQIGAVAPPIAALETNPTWFVEFSPDGRFLVTIDWEIHLWAIPST
jgi:WD40 repeat protein